jgi:hypothetical protein
MRFSLLAEPVHRMSARMPETSDPRFVDVLALNCSRARNKGRYFEGVAFAPDARSVPTTTASCFASGSFAGW